MALAGGGAGRTSVLVFTMPFWTMLMAWPVLHERVRGTQWLAVAFALVGLVIVVEPWHWEGELAPKLWATLSGFGWGAGTVATKYFQRRYQLDMLNLITWQMAVGVLPLLLVPLAFSMPSAEWSAVYVSAVIYAGVIATAIGFILWTAVLGVLPAGTASLNMFAIPVIAIVSSMLVFGERITATRMDRHRVRSASASSSCRHVPGGKADADKPNRSRRPRSRPDDAARYTSRPHGPHRAFRVR